MHLCTTQLFRSDLLSRRHLHQRWSAQKHLCLILDEDSVVGERRMVCAASRRRTEDNSACWLAVLRANRQITEDLTTFVENAKLLWEEDTCLRCISLSSAGHSRKRKSQLTD